MSNTERPLNPAQEWLMSIQPLDWQEHIKSAQCSIMTTPDFNEKPLNGEEPETILREYGIKVRILGRCEVGPHSISVHGPSAAVSRYMRHLMSTWPGLKQSSQST